ncbi:IS110 family transposase, partial [Peribacillus butanolivorans]|uniref:IS110 family transposase n=1 Tax=Peribacillus butanolivorans TaxID=421767 RepID=UPI00399C6520
IERISDNHLVVGVDIAQQLHVARAVNFRGIVVGDPLAFENNEDGFASLLKWMDKLQRLNKLEAAIVGMEPTGHYWINLELPCDKPLRSPASPNIPAKEI